MGRGTEKSGHIHRTKNERTKRGSWILLFAALASDAAVAANERLRERDSVKWERRRKKSGRRERERERATEEGARRGGTQHAHTLLASPSRQSNPAARRQKGETERGREERSCCTATVGRPFLLLSALLPSPSLATLPTEIEPDVVGRSEERKRGSGGGGGLERGGEEGG